MRLVIIMKVILVMRVALVVRRAAVTQVILVMRVALIILRAAVTQAISKMEAVKVSHHAQITEVISKMEAVKVNYHVSLILATLKKVAGKSSKSLKWWPSALIFLIHILLYTSYAHSHWIVNDLPHHPALKFGSLIIVAKAIRRVTKQLAQKARIAGKFQLMLNITMRNRPHHLD